jgi:hypothetical protein
MFSPTTGLAALASRWLLGYIGQQRVVQFESTQADHA